MSNAGPMQPTVHFPVNTLALKRGGLVKAVMARANALAAAALTEQVWIEVLAFQPRLEDDVAALKAAGHLHPDVRVRSVLYSLDDSDSLDDGASDRPDQGQRLWQDPELVRFPAGATAGAFRYFRHGVYEAYVRFDSAGIPEVVDHFSPARRRMRREEYDGRGLLVRTLSYPPTAGTPTVQRYIGRDGRCFLTIWQQPGKTDWGTSFLFGDQPREFAQTGALYRFALDRILAPEPAPVLCSEFRENLYNLPQRNLDDVVAGLRHPGLRRIATAHSNHLNPPYVAGSGVSPTWRRLLSNLDDWDALVVLTQAQRADLVNEFGHAERVKVIPHAAPRSRSEAAVDPDRVVLVARTHPKKRVDEAIRVFRLVADGNPRARLDVFGFGYADAEEKKVEALVEELGLSGQVRFAGFMEDLREVYAGACVTLLTSASEGFGMALLESLAFGVPVVAYDSNYGPRDVIDDGVNGYLVPFGDQSALADRVLALMRSSSLRSRMGTAGQESLRRFDSQQFVHLWSRVLASPPRSPASGSVGDGRSPVARAVRWEGDVLLLDIHVGPETPDARLIVRRRGSSAEDEFPMDGERVQVPMPPTQAGDILDFFVKGASASEGTNHRLGFGTPELHPHSRFQAYATAHGSFSVKDAAGSSAMGRPALYRALRRGDPRRD